MALYYDAELRAGADYRPEVFGGNTTPAWADDFFYVSHAPETIDSTLSGSVELPTVLLEGGFVGSSIPNVPLNNIQMQQLYRWVNDLALIHGLVAGADLVVTPNSRTAGTVTQSISTAGSTVTVTR